jgi:uncharacterized protein (DUF2164 family)
MQFSKDLITGLGTLVAGGAKVGQPQFFELPFLITDAGESITVAMEFTQEEIANLLLGAKVYLTMNTGGGVMPIRAEVLTKEFVAEKEGMLNYFKVPKLIVEKLLSIEEKKILLT